MTTPSESGASPAPSGKPAAKQSQAKRKKRDPEGRMRLAEHLIEFRNRLVISAIGIVAGMVGGFFLTDFVFNSMRAPLEYLASTRPGMASINWVNVTSAFDLRLQVAFTIGIVISSPVWLYQAWMFLVPGLKKSERRYVVGFLGAAIPLFLGGVATGWYLMPHIVEVMIGFAPSQDASLLDAKTYYTFVLTLCLAVGIAYVLPVFIVLLNFAGVVEGRTILKSWRVAVLSTALFAAIATPSADVLSMFLLMVPMIALFFIATGISLLNDRRRAKRRAKLEDEIDASLSNRD